MISTLLHNQQIRLTALTLDDLPTVGRWHQDPTFLRLFDARPARPRTATELSTWLEAQHKDSTAFVLGARLIDDADLLGYIELDGIHWTHGSAWLAYCIGDEIARGKGYGTASVRLALQFAFDELNLHRIQATVFSYNQASMRLLQKLGFQHEGTYREALHRDGQRHDMWLYGLLRNEYDGTS